MFEKDIERRWHCFICGQKHNTYESFREHIVNKHMEGQDYVVCALCEAPVRDLKLHHNYKHPNSPIPKYKIFKPLFFRDPKTHKKHKPVFRTGYFVSNKNNGKEYYYRSGLEAKFMETFEQINEIESYAPEPFSIDYLFEGEPHKYFPDFILKFTDGHHEVIEIKPENFCEVPKNISKWKAATNYCSARNWNFIVFTEEALEKLQQRVRKTNAMG